MNGLHTLSIPSAPPRITGDGRVREDVSELAMDLVSAPFVKMNCELSVSTSPSTVIYWYKDGENVTDFYNSTTGELKYVVDRHEVDNLFGVYQCFAENSAGVDYTITRVLPHGKSSILILVDTNAYTRGIKSTNIHTIL